MLIDAKRNAKEGPRCMHSCVFKGDGYVYAYKCNICTYGRGRSYLAMELEGSGWVVGFTALRKGAKRMGNFGLSCFLFFCFLIHTITTLLSLMLLSRRHARKLAHKPFAACIPLSWQKSDT